MTVLLAADGQTGTGEGVSTITLVNGAQAFALQPNAEIVVQGWNLGFPTIRAVAEARTDADGEVDTTAHYGARAVSIQLRILGPNRLRLIDSLLAFCHPTARPYLHISTPLWAQERRLRLRVDQHGAPMGLGLGTTRPAQFGWIAPDGILESAAESSVTIAPSGQTSTGLVYPVTYPVTYPVATSGGPVTVTNAGNVPVDHVTRMYGPANGPVLSCDGAGSLPFPGLVIAAGDYVEVNSRERTVLYQGSADASRYNLLDFTAATWWRLQPGPNLVRYSPASYSGGAAAEMTFRSGWL